jgi:hypothetical protein
MAEYGMLQARIALNLGSGGEGVAADLSAVAVAPEGHIWVASDELTNGRVAISRLEATGTVSYGRATEFALGDFVSLLDPRDEADIEGMDIAGGCLWFTGSHSLKRLRPKGKDRKTDVERLATVRTERNRFLLGRIPLVSGGLAVAGSVTNGNDGTPAARMGSTDDGTFLIRALKADDHLGPMIAQPLPAKENGFDIEGLAVRNGRVFLGLRGPVLRGWAAILEIEPDEHQPGMLSLAEMGKADRLVRKHFVDLAGLGIRDLCWRGDDLLILAGSTLASDGAMRIYRLKDAGDLPADSMSRAGSKSLRCVLDLPIVPGGDYAEGISLFPWLDQDAVLVVYDAPAAQRLPASGIALADVFRLPA